MHVLGIVGNPRRYADFREFEFMKDSMPIHTFMTHAAIFTGVVQLIFLVNLFWSLYKGAKAPQNPWDATTLEWTIPSPPPFDNFGGHHPVVNHGPYEFALPGKEKDHVMQTDPA
jgi:cytochrome c oxidase subunit 1